jgi:hypothetical protein
MSKKTRLLPQPAYRFGDNEGAEHHYSEMGEGISHAAAARLRQPSSASPAKRTVKPRPADQDRRSAKKVAAPKSAFAPPASARWRGRRVDDC